MLNKNKVMIIKICITEYMYIVANVIKELMSCIESVYIIEQEPDYVSSYDIIATYKMGEILIKYLNKEVYCNEQNFDFCFVTAIEDIAVTKSNDFIYHGSAITYDNKFTLAFVGSSRSGKTTIVENLESYSSRFRRISDDLLILNGTQLHGIFLPTKIRINSHNNDMDRKSIKHATLLNSKVSDGKFNLSLIISVKYSLSNINSFTRLDTFDGVKTLVSNSRSAPNNFKLMQNVTAIVKSIPIYNLNYHDDFFAVDCLVNALKI